MINFFFTLIICFCVTFSVFSQEDSKAVKNRKEQLERQEEEKRKQGEKAHEEGVEKHMEIQTKETRKRMKKNQKKSKRINHNRNENFFQRLFSYYPADKKYFLQKHKDVVNCSV